MSLLQNKFETKKAKYIHTYSKKQYFSIWGAKKSIGNVSSKKSVAYFCCKCISFGLAIRSA